MKKKGLVLWMLLACMGGLWGPSMAGAEADVPVALYVGVAAQNITIRSERSLEAKGVGHIAKGEKAYILSYEPGWLEVVKQTGDGWATGYVLRHTVFDIEAAGGETTPYGATPAVYTCTLSRDAVLYEAPERVSDPILTMERGTRLAILSIRDGWAQVIRWRQYGYFRLDAAENLTPVYDVDTAQPGDTIAAFTSFYNTSQKGLNPNRMLNIDKACEYIHVTLPPGEAFSFNGTAGPYRKNRGYLEAPAFVGGETVASNGGGTCQVSSTLYNVLLPLEGITIVYRVAHGAGGAAYLPHGVDAACGNERIDLKFRNDFDFPVRIEAGAKGGALFIALVRG